MRHLHEFENRPIKLQNKILEKVLDIAQLTSEEKNEYGDSLKTYNDLKNTLDTAENKGYLKAEELFLPQIEEVKARELEERRQKEEALLKQQVAQNREKEALLTLKNTILNLQANGFDLTKIASILGKSDAEILAILNGLTSQVLKT